MKNTIVSHLVQARQRPENLKAAQYKLQGHWRSISWRELYKFCEKVSEGLKAIGLTKGKRAAIWSQTRLEWAISDLAILGSGAVTIPIYHNSLSDEVIHILNDSEADILILENEHIWNIIKPRLSELKKTVEMVSIETIESSDFTGWSWTRLLKKGSELADESPTAFEESCLAVNEMDIATIVYTSGTTGAPKGALIGHDQVISEIAELVDKLQLNEKDVSLTFLPFAHVLGRIEYWGSIYSGFCMTFAESIERMARNLHEISPTFIIGVPRIFEKIYLSIQTDLQNDLVKSKIFKWALAAGDKLTAAQDQKKLPSWSSLLQYRAADKVVFKKVRQKLGGRLRFAFSGGAPLEKEVGRFFHTLGILILEGYGLTETTGGITVNSPTDFEFGTIGKPFGDVKIKLDDDGEILVQSKKVMRGYLNQKEATDEVFKDGFFRTGDIGEWTAEGNLRITDRKKDLIKTAGGKYVAPQKLENLLRLNPLVSNALIHGDRRKYIVALVTLNAPAARELLQKSDIQNLERMNENPVLEKSIREYIASVNSQLASYETIKSFKILPHDFTVENDELTPSLKIKRRNCEKKFKAELDSLYGE